MRHIEKAHGAVDKVQSDRHQGVERSEHQHGGQKLARQDDAQVHRILRMRPIPSRGRAAQISARATRIINGSSAATEYRVTWSMPVWVQRRRSLRTLARRSVLGPSGIART